MNLEKLVRENIWKLKPYSSARDEFQGNASVFLDANESPYNAPYDRYPDPKQWKVKEKISIIRNIAKEKIVLGNGSDEVIDLAIRIFCEPGKDNIVSLDPTYGIYKVAANINHVEYREVLLNENFDFKAEDLLKATDQHTKLIFLCSPNNPTGNSLNRNEIFRVLDQFDGIVIIDEAYIDFSRQLSFLPELDQYPNLIIFQTFSKSWASAGVRLGIAYASEEIIHLYNKVKYPYNINILTQDYVLNLLNNYSQLQVWIDEILQERNRLEQELLLLSCVEKIYPSDANFLLIKVKNADAIYNYLVNKGIIVRNRNTVSLCMGCIRITVGTEKENQLLIETLKEMNV